MDFLPPTTIKTQEHNTIIWMIITTSAALAIYQRNNYYLICPLSFNLGYATCNLSHDWWQLIFELQQKYAGICCALLLWPFKAMNLNNLKLNDECGCYGLHSSTYFQFGVCYLQLVPWWQLIFEATTTVDLETHDLIFELQLVPSHDDYWSLNPDKQECFRFYCFIQHHHHIKTTTALFSLMNREEK
jgi:hypothetical protein